MEYEDIYEEILVFANEELNCESLNHLNNINSMLKNRFIDDFKKGEKTFGAYSFYLQNLIDMLKNKIMEKYPNIKNENALSLANKIVNGGILVTDIIVVDDMAFIEGRSAINYAGSNHVESGMVAMNDILSNNFVNPLNKSESVNMIEGQKLYLQLIESINTAIKYILIKDVDAFVMNNQKNIVYGSPNVHVYTLKTLDDLNGSRDDYSFELAVLIDNECYSLKVELRNGIVRIYKDCDNITRLSGEKEKIKRK